MSTERTITLRKRMAASKCKDKEGREVQFLGSGYINSGSNNNNARLNSTYMELNSILMQNFRDVGHV